MQIAIPKPALVAIESSNVSFANIHESLPAEVFGGKANNLITLANQGIHIPEGWILPTSWFTRHIRRNGLEKLALSVAKSPSEAGCNEVSLAIVHSPMHADVISAIKKLPEGSYSVRSSATVEDSRKASYSGLFETKLGIIGVVEIAEAIKHVWASVFTCRALSYHNRFSNNSPYPAMAVLVMRMVDAESSGVAFSVNPASGNPFEITIMACGGLGSTVVDGNATCDRYILDFDTRQIVEHISGTQTQTAFLATDGRVVRRSASAANGGRLLDRILLDILGETVQRIDEFLACRVDVEFAFSGTRLWILQARPALGIPAWFPDSPIERDARFYCLHQTWTDPLPAFVQALHKDGPRPTSPPPPWPLEEAEVCLHLGRLFGRSPEHPEYEDQPDAVSEDRTFLRRMLALDDPESDFCEWYLWTEQAYDSLIPSLRAYAEATLLLERRYLSAIGSHELCMLLEEALVMEQKAAAFYVSASYPTYESLRRIDILVQDWLMPGDWKQSTQAALTLLQGSPKLTLERDMAMEEVALEGRNEHDFICRWGYSYLVRDEILDISRWRSWREDPALFRTAIELIRRMGAPADIGKRFQESKRVGEAAISKYTQAVLHSDPDQGAKRERVFKACIQACRRHFGLKDDRDLVRSHVQAALCWILMEGANRLVSYGILKRPDDVYHLQPDEVTACLRSPQDCGSLVKEIDARKSEMHRFSRYSPVIDTKDHAKANLAGKQLQGWPASAGIGEGNARVVDVVSPGGVTPLQPGEILVLKGEGKLGWTLFFPIIAGLVYESGNWLCHESNLCRELGIPAVVGLQEGIDAIRTGERLRINGATGEVVRLDVKSV